MWNLCVGGPSNFSQLATNLSCSSSCSRRSASVARLSAVSARSIAFSKAASYELIRGPDLGFSAALEGVEGVVDDCAAVWAAFPEDSGDAESSS